MWSHKYIFGIDCLSVPDSCKNIVLIGVKTLGNYQLSLILVFTCKTVVTKSSEQLVTPKYTQLRIRVTADI